MKMPTVMKLTAVGAAVLTVLFAMLGLKSAAITFGTTCYHFSMRLAVGAVIDLLMHNRANCYAPWFVQKKWEPRLYKLLRVKKWKGRFPTYDPSLFDARLHSISEIAQATCQAELVHEVIVVLSFLPLLAAVPFGSFPVFLITSLAAACFDLIFVIMQRFNRPRLLKLIKKVDAK